jgi:hypothetical protein
MDPHRQTENKEGMADSEYNNSRRSPPPSSPPPRGSEQTAPHFPAHAPPFAQTFPSPSFSPYATVAQPQVTSLATSQYLGSQISNHREYFTTISHTGSPPPPPRSPFDWDMRVEAPPNYSADDTQTFRPEPPVAHSYIEVLPSPYASGYGSIGGWPHEGFSYANGQQVMDPGFPYGRREAISHHAMPNPPTATRGSPNRRRRPRGHPSQASDVTRHVHFENALASPEGSQTQPQSGLSPVSTLRRPFDVFNGTASATSSHAYEAAARVPPHHRAPIMSIETMRAHFLALRNSISDQLRDFKNTLPRSLPNELPALKSTICSICTTEYSTVHVPPTEDAEVAVMLSCGHCFGEWCLFQWVCIVSSSDVLRMAHSYRCSSTFASKTNATSPVRCAGKFFSTSLRDPIQC